MFDALIIGAGPAGLSLAKFLAEQKRRVAILEQQPLAAIANPAFDGREIALTQHSMALLTDMGVTPYFQEDEFATLHSATVLNGHSDYQLDFTPPASADKGLGYMVSNCAIRRGLYQVVSQLDNVTLITKETPDQIHYHSDTISVTTQSGKEIKSRLLVAADSRFSNTRKKMGIGATMTDYGKSMLVCRMTHTTPHQETAYEIFDIGQTLALLPLAGNCSSVVVTLPTPEIEALQSLDAEAFTTAIGSRLKHKLGAMQLVSERFAYPLVSVYADRFVSERFALIGDAAVGMHPVTAHGFNLGLLGAETLAKQVAGVNDIGRKTKLAKFERAHKRATLPLYLGTNTIAKLYADDRAPARVVRGTGLRVANLLHPIKRKVVKRLMAA